MHLSLPEPVLGVAVKKRSNTKMQLKYYLTDIFSDHEFASIDRQWLNSEVELQEVVDLTAFIESCEYESRNVKIAGPSRKKDWEWGWKGNGITNEFPDFPNIPYYFKKNTHVRIGQQVFEDKTKLTELKLLRMIQDIAFSHIEKENFDAIIEYGAGTGHNINYLKSKFPKVFYGADWAQASVDKMIKEGVVSASQSFCVDYFTQSSFKEPKEKYCAFTNASLEQSGSCFKEFMRFIVDSPSCRAGVHIEPMWDLISPHSALNRASIRYMKKRGYLDGFYEFMRAQNIDIICKKDFGLGSKYLSGYQLIVWIK